LDKSHKFTNKYKPEKGKAKAPKTIQTFMDSDKKRKFKRGSGLMPKISNMLMRKDLTPFDQGISKK